MSASYYMGVSAAYLSCLRSSDYIIYSHEYSIRPLPPSPEASVCIHVDSVPSLSREGGQQLGGRKTLVMI